MGVFMGQQHIRDTADKLVAELGRDDVPAYQAAENFFLMLENVRNILSTGEADSDTSNYVNAQIQQAETYARLGIIINGVFSRLNPAMACRFSIEPGQFISGRRFLVVTEEQFDALTSKKSISLPDDAIWDSDSNSLIHKSFYFRRHPRELIELAPEEISSFGLDEAMQDAILEGYKDAKVQKAIS